MAADIEFLHKRLDDVVDDVTRLFNLRNDVAQSVNQLHQTLINAEDEACSSVSST